MLQSAWLFVGVIALFTTGIAVSTQTTAAQAYPNDDSVAIVSGVLGFVSWGLWSFGALNVETYTETGALVAQSMPELTYMGVALAIVPGYIALTGPVNIVRRARNPDARDI